MPPQLSEFPRTTRFALAGLERALLYDLGVEPDFTANGETRIDTTVCDHYPVYQLARILGTDRVNIYRWREFGITHERADILAGRIGVPTLSVWPDYYDEYRFDRRRKRTRHGLDRRSDRGASVRTLPDSCEGSDGRAVEASSGAAR